MRRPTLILATLAAMLGISQSLHAQNDIIVSQYIHNRFAINPAFAGCREGLSIYGGFRKQWTGIENTPHSLLLTAHAPLRSEKLTAGVSIFGQGIHESTNAGLLATVGYRTQIKRDVWLGFALQPGIAMRSTNWAAAKTMDPQDPIFEEKETGLVPQLGFGAAIYAQKFFGGISIQSLLVSDDFERRKAEFAPADATFILTGGYWFDLSDQWALQPSVLADYSQKRDLAAAITVSGVYNEKLWGSLACRTTTKDMMIGVAYVPRTQLKIAYNYSLTLGDLKTYDAGSHEISIQYDFVYRVKTVSHRFY